MMSDIISKSFQSHFVQGLYQKVGSRGWISDRNVKWNKSRDKWPTRIKELKIICFLQVTFWWDDGYAQHVIPLYFFSMALAIIFSAKQIWIYLVPLGINTLNPERSEP
jgi:hypothetical protein